MDSLHSAENDHRPVVESLPIVARYRGRCPGCRGVIRVGDSIQPVDHRYHHEECVPYGAVEAWGEEAA